MKYKDRNILFVLMVAGIILRLAVIFTTRSYLYPEFFEYENVIKNILSGNGFIYNNAKFKLDYYIAIHPLFTFICAGIYFITNHSFFAMELFQVVISVGTAYLIYLIGKDIFNRQTGLIAAALTIFHPGQIIYSTVKIHSTIMDTFFFVLVAFWILKTRESMKLRDFAILGLFIGLGSLARGTLIIYFPLAMLYFVIFVKDNLRFVFKKLSVSFLAMVLILSPWWIRNYLVLKHPVYMTTESMGYTLWVGFNEKATGTLWTLHGNTQWNEASEKLKNEVFSQKNELSQQKVFRKEAIDFISSNPAKSLILYAQRLLYFWWFTPTQGMFYPKVFFAVYKIFYIICLFFAIFALLKVFTRGSNINKGGIFIILSILVLLGLLQGLYYVEGRHRWEVEPLLLLLTAYGVQRLVYGRAK